MKLKPQHGVYKRDLEDIKISSIQTIDRSWFQGKALGYRHNVLWYKKWQTKLVNGSVDIFLLKKKKKNSEPEEYLTFIKQGQKFSFREE